jgi:hypothetical protein
MVQGLSSNRVERFSVNQYNPNIVGTTQPPIQWVLGSYLEAKLPLPVHESEHSNPPSAKFKNEWSYATTPPICLHGVERGNLPLLKLAYEFASQTV